MEEYRDAVLGMVRRELQRAGTVPSETLRVQNHIYGCFLVMEDLADGDLQLTADYHLESGKQAPSLSLQNAFGDLGLHYGFVQDPRAAWKTVPTDYRHAWTSFFRELQLICDMDVVDAMEEQLDELIRDQVTDPSVAFFAHALDETALDAADLDRIFATAPTASVTTTAPATFHAPIDPVTKSPVQPPPSSRIHRRLARTFRSARDSNKVPATPRRRLSKTHRRPRTVAVAAVAVVDAPVVTPKEPIAP